VLKQIDGPMLRHGLQEMHGRSIHLPTTVATTPIQPTSKNATHSSAQPPN
jgi:hypothetical protein